MSLAKIGLNILQNNGFSRLKGIFRKGINYTSYNKIVGSAKNKIIGNIPKDMLNLIISRNPQNKAESIKTAQKAFENAAVILSDGEKLQRQAINRMNPSLENVCKFIENLETKEPYHDKLFLNKNAEILCRAESEMYKKLKPLFPELGNIRLSLIGEGGFANVYRCQILDKNKQNIVADTVIKSFKSGTANTELAFRKLDMMFDKYSDEEILQYAKKNGLNITKEQIAMTKTLVGMTSEQVKESSLSSLIYTQSMHGASAESNISENLRYFSGHKLNPSDGIVIPDMFCHSKNPFYIAKYIDENQFAKHEFNFQRLGLDHTDLAANPGNTANGICLDIGGIRGVIDRRKLMISEIPEYETFAKATASEIVGNKQAMRILKRIHNLKSTEEILSYIKSLEDYALNCKNELKKKTILTTLKEIKDKNLYPKHFNTYKAMTTQERKLSEEEVEELMLDPSIYDALKNANWQSNSQEVVTRTLCSTDPQITKLKKYGSL